MVTQINNTCDTITITESNHLTSWMDNPGTYNLVLKYRLNCTDEYQEYTVQTTDVSGTSPDYVFTITTTDLINKPEFEQGVYSFVMELETIATGDKQSEVSCTLSACNLQCDVVTYQVNNPNSLVHMWYVALEKAVECDTCDCSKPCAIYNKILDMIEYDTDDCQCG